MCCSVLQLGVFEDSKGSAHCVAMCCSVLKCVAVCCSVLHYVAVCCGALQLQCVGVCCGVLLCIAVCCGGCSILQRVSVRCSELCDAVRCNVLQGVVL